jgi:hypothetical protein
VPAQLTVVQSSWLIYHEHSLTWYAGVTDSMGPKQCVAVTAHWSNPALSLYFTQ